MQYMRILQRILQVKQGSPALIAVSLLYLQYPCFPALLAVYLLYCSIPALLAVYLLYLQYNDVSAAAPSRQTKKNVLMLNLLCSTAVTVIEARASEREELKAPRQRGY